MFVSKGLRVRDPKSVCSPKDFCSSVFASAAGGDRTQRTWSPEWVVSLCMFCSVESGSPSFVFKSSRSKVTMAWDWRM